MDIIISKSELSNALAITQTVVSKKTTMPILANLLLSATDGTLRISATDLEITAVVKAEGAVKTPGSTTINARMFSEVVRELPDGDVHLKITEGERLNVTAQNSNFMMVGVSAEEYPSLPGISLPTSGKISAALMREMIDKTVYAVSHDETRFNLNGVCFDITTPSSASKSGTKTKTDTGKIAKQLRMVATDGHRLALISRPVGGGLEFTGSVIVPTKGLQELRRILEDEGGNDVGVAMSEGFFLVEGARAKIAVRLIDGEFPDYQRVIPEKPGVLATVPCVELTQALRRAALMVSDKGKCVKLDFAPGAGTTGKLRISSSSPELGESTEEIGIEYSGETVSIGFNAKYLLDYAGTVEESKPFLMELSGELGPTKLRGEGDDSSFGIVMPMRLT